MKWLDYAVDVSDFVLKGNLMWENGVIRKHNEINYGIEYQRYTKDHL
jgi:hypothetical protein